MSDSSRPELPSGIVAFVKRDCPTCELVAPVLAELARRVALTRLHARTTRPFPRASTRVDDTLARGLLAPRDRGRADAAARRGRASRAERASAGTAAEWEALTGVAGLGPGLPDWRPGCGSLIGRPEPRAPSSRCASAAAKLRARRVELARARGRDRGDVRARLERRAAARAAHREARARHARGHDPRARRGRRGRAAGPRRVQRREGRDQRGHGGLQARVPAGRAGRRRGRLHRRVQHARAARDHHAGRPGARS